MSNELMTCPYDKSHKILSSRFLTHIVKCSKSHPPLAICIYNATHRMPVEKMLDHLEVCTSKKILMTTMVQKSHKSNLRPITHEKEDAIVMDEEEWD